MAVALAQIAPPAADQGAWAWIAGVLVVGIGGIFGLYTASLRSRAADCCRERDELRKASDAALVAYRERDEEDRRAWQDWQRRDRERPQEARR